jgi:hypothetical protein
MKILEKATNVAIIVGVVVFVAVAVTDRLTPRGQQPAPVDPAKRLLGKTLHIPGIAFPQPRNSLLLVLSTTCHYCTDSLPFYRELAAKSAGHVDLVAALPQPLPEAQAYLQQAAVPVAHVISPIPGAIGVAGTPTLLLVDRAGMVRDVWLGALDEKSQREVLSRVQL